MSLSRGPSQSRRATRVVLQHAALQHTTTMALSTRATQRLERDFDTSFPYPPGAWYDAQTNPGGIINMGTAENSMLSERVIQDIHERFHLRADHLKYRDAILRNNKIVTTADALPVYLNRTLRPLEPLTVENTIPGPGVGALLAHFLWAVLNEGEGVLLSTPYYTDYPRDVVYPARGRVVPSHIPANVDSLSVAAIPYIEDTIQKSNAAGTRVKVLLVCNPHNPLGRAYPEDTLRAYAELAEKYDAHLLLDEVFANQVFASSFVPDPQPFVSILSLQGLACSPSRVHVLAGPTKDLGASGLKLAAFISRRADILKLVRAALSAFPVSSATDAALAPLLIDERWTEEFLEENRRRLREAFEIAAGWCAAHRIPFEPTSAGVFMVVNFASLVQDLGSTAEERLDAARSALVGAGVFMRPTTTSLDPLPYRFRFVFSHPKETLVLGLQRLEKAFGLDSAALPGS